MPRVFAASNTLTVPPMLTAVPYGGSALMLREQKRSKMDDVRDAAVVEDLRERLTVGDVALDERDFGVGGKADAPVVVPRSKPTTSVPSVASSAQVQAPMQPSAPVTRNRSPALTGRRRS